MAQTPTPALVNAVIKNMATVMEMEYGANFNGAVLERMARSALSTALPSLREEADKAVTRADAACEAHESLQLETAKLQASHDALVKALERVSDRLNRFVMATADITDCSADVDALNAADAALTLARGA